MTANAFCGTSPTRQRTSAEVNVDQFLEMNMLKYVDELHSLDFTNRYKKQGLELLNLQPGHRVLDVGCTAGDDTLELIDKVAPNGTIVGVDTDEYLTMAAIKQAARVNLSDAVRFDVAPSYSKLDYAACSFDRCRADLTLMHVAEPVAVVEEMYRILDHDGIMVISEPDWETVVLDVDDKRTTRIILNFLCDHFIRNGWVGRSLYRMCREAGLNECRCEITPVSFSSIDEAEILLRLREAGRMCLDAGLISENQFNV